MSDPVELWFDPLTEAWRPKRTPEEAWIECEMEPNYQRWCAEFGGPPSDPSPPPSPPSPTNNNNTFEPTPYPWSP